MSTLTKRFKSDPLYRNKTLLIIFTIWNALICIYYFLVGYMQKSGFSWFYGLTIWYGVLTIFKIILLSKIPKFNSPVQVDYDLILIVYYFINLFEILAITSTPVFVTSVFANKMNGFTFGSLAISIVNIALFIGSWTIKYNDKLTPNENGFIRTKFSYARTEGFFNVLLIAINILIVLKVERSTISYAYLGIGWTFIIICLVLAIKLIKKRKANKK